jgi:hypothetical protein
MTKDDIIRMAREANFGFMTEKPKSATHMQCGIDDLERFFHMAQAAEREACIDIVAIHGGSVEIEAAIRARAQA